jgi:hypothetical protein
MKHCVGAVLAASLLVASAAAAAATPTPMIVEEPTLHAQVDVDGNIEQVYATFVLSNTVARPKGVKRAVELTIAGRLAESHLIGRRGGTRWRSTLLGENGSGLELARTYTVVLTACGSKRCATRKFREQLQAD